MQALVAYMRAHHVVFGASISETGLDWSPLPTELDELIADRRFDPSNSRGLGELAEESQLRTIAAFGRCWATGYAEITVGHAEHDGPLVLTLWDVRDSVGTMIALLVPGEADPEVEFGGSPLRPRVMIHTADEMGRTRSASPTTTTLLGWDVDEIIGTSRLDYVHPDDQVEAIAAWAEMLVTPGLSSRRQVRYQHRNGHYVWFETTMRNDLESEGHVHVEMVDISESLATLDRLHQREQLLEHLTQQMPQAIMHLSTTGEMLYVSDNLRTILGAEPSIELILASIPIGDRDRLLEGFRDSARGGQADVDGDFIRPDGGIRRCLVRLRSLREHGAGVLITIEDITEEWADRKRLEHEATIDPLTGVLNRRATHTRLGEALDAARISGAATTVAFVDLDGFKEVNDRLGHQFGDQVLVTVASELRNSIRGADWVGRLGGDEFVVICHDTDERQAEVVAERLRRAVTIELDLDGERHGCEASVGIATNRGGTMTGADLIAAADQAMYAEKQRRSSTKA